jgi:hypothetical protein
MDGFGRAVCVAMVVVATSVSVCAAQARPAGGDPFLTFELPDDWESKFWDTPGLKAFLELDPKALAGRVPEQAGLRHCRCPNCDAPESADPLRWSPEKPDFLTCAACSTVFPNDKYPAKVEGKVPEDVVEVRPRVFHAYPYHAVDPGKQTYTDERLYLAAKRDYELREFLAKAALYAAIRFREQPAGQKDPALAQFACVILVRFAQVYPFYATHCDQPGKAKLLQPANLGPPYRRDYQSAKWDWSGCLDVPMNLVIAYAILRNDPALLGAGRILNDPHPHRTIERDFFRASAQFVSRQPEEYSESSLLAYRGMLAIGRLLDDPALVLETERRLIEFMQRGFYHDGVWRRGDLRAQRRILDQVDGWFKRLLPVDDAPQASSALALARAAEASVLSAPRSPEVLRAAWPAPGPRPTERHAALLGGAGIVRLSVGQDVNALDLELRGLGDLGGQAHTDRLSFRLSVSGKPVLGDLDDAPPCPNGWDLATASHNAVLVDGLNQREAPDMLRTPVPGSDILFFAADPDFQVVTMEDRFAYPKAAARYRHTLVACSGARSRYAVSVFEATGGLEHTQIFQAAPAHGGRFSTALRMYPGPSSLLPSAIAYLTTARADDGRWFVQAMGAFENLTQAHLDRATQVSLAGRGPGVKLHLLTNLSSPANLIAGTSEDPTASASDEPDRSALILRRRSSDGSSLSTVFVTVLAPTGREFPPLVKVGRVVSGPDTVVLVVQSQEGGAEHIVVNLTPGTPRAVDLADGSTLTTDGLVARFSRTGLSLAGGTFAEVGGRRAGLSRVAGTLIASGRDIRLGARGWFESEFVVPEVETLPGRALLVRHGDGTCHGWTIQHAENLPAGGTRFYVREEPGFIIDLKSKEARYYHFPRINVGGPHVFRVCKIARG